MGLPHFMLVLNGFWFYLVARDRGHLHESGFGFGRDQESTVILNNVCLPPSTRLHLQWFIFIKLDWVWNQVGGKPMCLCLLPGSVS